MDTHIAGIVHENILYWIRQQEAEEEEEEDEGIVDEQCPSDTVDVARAPKEEAEGGEEDEDELAEYGLDKYDEDTGECVCAHSSFLLKRNLNGFVCPVTANLGDSLAGLTVFSSNAEDPYITLKDTVGNLHDFGLMKDVEVAG